MIGIAICFSAVVALQSPSGSPGSDRPEAKAEAPPREALSKYNELRAKAPETAAGQWKLATWCEQNGLKSEAMVHLAAVVRLDPRRDAAWRKLGYKRHEGRWMTDAMVAAEAEEKKADKAWGQQLRSIHRSIHGGPRRDEAEAALGKVTDPSAIPSIYREFCGGGGVDQLIAIQVLGQIDGPTSSRTLAVLGVYGKTPEVRRAAIESLRRRPAEDYLAMFVSLMRDPIRYEVRPVGGPGSPGILFVEGERYDLQRFYAPPAPRLTPRFGDSIGYDMNGMPVAFQSMKSNMGRVGVAGSKTLAYDREKQTNTEYFIPDAAGQAQRAALAAQQQLDTDVAQVEATNQARDGFNALLVRAAKDATGKSPGNTPKDWRDFLATKDNKYAKATAKAAFKPTLSELVPVDFAYSVASRTNTTFLTKTVVDT